MSENDINFSKAGNATATGATPEGGTSYASGSPGSTSGGSTSGGSAPGGSATSDATAGGSGSYAEGTSGRQLRRLRDDRMVAGVCSGVARYLGVDANIVRLGLTVFTVFGGAGVAAYILGWLLIPEEGNDTSMTQDILDKYVTKKPQA